MDCIAPDGEISRLLRKAAAGDAAAINSICETYRPRLCRLIRAWGGHRISPSEDEEDLAQVALFEIARNIQAGKFARIESWEGFSKLAKRLAHNIVSSRVRHYRCRKRGGGFQQLPACFDMESIPAPAAPEFDDEDLEAEFYRFLYVEFSREPLFWQLSQLQQLGKRVEEMARVCRISVPTVYSKLRLRERLWQEYLQLSDATKRHRRKIEDARRWRTAAAAHAEHVLAQRGELPPGRPGRNEDFLRNLPDGAKFRVTETAGPPNRRAASHCFHRRGVGGERVDVDGSA